MEALRFKLRGKTAFFKIPEVNTYLYFTYGNIHKPVLLGMFGAILGYDGYKDGYEDFPDYYKKLRNLKVSVVPESKNGCFSKKVQAFNNSVGYASKENGGNLIVKEQWLEEPCWTIYVMLDNDESIKLAKNIIEKRCVYIPYLGTNDHPAVIENAEKVVMNNMPSSTIDSLVPSKYADFDWDTAMFKYGEYLPIALNKDTNHYELEKFVFTDAEAEVCRKTVYSDGVRNIVFY
ncbi:MAG: type I-B CRISPR-associated protein Cas5b [Clostridia bacterium]|jgi:CRISPR-associated protein Cas5h|nr:type I-B CRISPR-associated protein Cas5b [Clostridia bacterium]